MNEGWGSSSVLEHLPGMCKALGSNLNTKRGKEGEKERKRESDE
jgi:hypothetical protein